MPDGAVATGDAPSARTVKDPTEWTADEICAVIPKVLHDPKAVEACIRLLAVRDPHRAQLMLDSIEFGLFLAGKDA